jgi:hypothetical protein
MKKLLFGLMTLTSVTAFAECNLNELVSKLERNSSSEITIKKVTSRSSAKFQSTENWSDENGGTVKLLITRQLDEKLNFCEGRTCFPHVTRYEADYLMNLTFDSSCNPVGKTSWVKLSERSFINP